MKTLICLSEFGLGWRLVHLAEEFDATDVDSAFLIAHKKANLKPPPPPPPPT